MTDRLRGTYGLTVAFTLLALCPDLVLSTALPSLSTSLVRDLGTSLTWVQVANGLSNAAFAAGCVVAAQLAQRWVQRPLFLGYAATVVAGSALAAWTPSMPLFLLGRTLQGGATGMMMISALPPLVTRFGVRRLPWSVALVNVGLFGATTLGPSIGALVADSGSWRTLMGVVTGVAALALVTAWLGYPRFDPVAPDLPIDVPALGLSLLSAVLLFTATSVVTATSLSSWVFWVLSLGGLAALTVLVQLERRRERPLMPVGELVTQLPVTGTVVAMVAGATFVTATGLTGLYLTDVARSSPTTISQLFWAMPLGLLPAAVAFGLVFRTSLLPYLVNVGLVALVAAAALLLVISASGTTAGLSWAAGLLGFGAGATVAPGLFLAGLGVRSRLLGRAFALVQLLRLTATFAVAPVVLYLAQLAHSPATGVRLGLWITLALAAAGLVASLVIPAVSGARPHAPDLEAWLEDGERAMTSPTTAVHLRPGVDDDAAHDLVPSRVRGDRDRS